MTGDVLSHWLFGGGTHKEVMSISEAAITAPQLDSAKIAAASNRVLITKEYADATYSSSAVVTTTWEDLVSSQTREALQLYDITGSADSTKNYGKIMLISPTRFMWEDSNENIQIIKIE
jgi:hypothetical protein